MSRRTLTLLGLAGALAVVLVVLKLVGGGHPEDPAGTASEPERVAATSAPQAPSIQTSRVVTPYWAKPAPGEATAQDFAHAPLVAPSAVGGPLKPTEAQKVTPPAAQHDELVRQLPSKSTVDGAAARAEDKFGPLSKRERMALERQVQAKKADRVPGTQKMRDTLMRAECTGPDAQRQYRELATDADRAAMRRRCAPFGFQPAP